MLGRCCPRENIGITINYDRTCPSKMVYQYDFLADRRNVILSVYLRQIIGRFRSNETFNRPNTKKREVYARF